MTIPDLQEHMYLHKSHFFIPEFSASSNYEVFAFKSILLLPYETFYMHEYLLGTLYSLLQYKNKKLKVLNMCLLLVVLGQS